MSNDNKESSKSRISSSTPTVASKHQKIDINTKKIIDSKYNEIEYDIETKTIETSNIPISISKHQDKNLDFHCSILLYVANLTDIKTEFHEIDDDKIVVSYNWPEELSTNKNLQELLKNEDMGDIILLGFMNDLKELKQKNNQSISDIPRGKYVITLPIQIDRTKPIQQKIVSDDFILVHTNGLASTYGVESVKMLSTKKLSSISNTIT